MEVIDSLAIKDLEVRDRDNHWWSVRIRPYKTMDNKIDGAVVALVDIDLLKLSAERAGAGRELAEAVINTVRLPLVLLDKDLNIKSVNAEFCRGFKVSREETLNRRIYDLGNRQWDIPRLRSLLEEILPHNGLVRDFPVNHNFPTIGEKAMLLNAQRLDYDSHKQKLILLAIEDVTKHPPSTE
jgi:two-component system CheB/CheR fusion protein